MRDEAGQVAIYGVAGDRAALDCHSSGCARAMLLFMDDPSRFRRAESHRYSDDRRRGRIWDAFEGAPGREVARDVASVDALQEALRNLFATPNVHVDIYDRSRPTGVDDAAQLVQINLYQETQPDEDWVFDSGTLTTRARRPVVEAAVSYEPEAGTIEVVSRDRVVRAQLAELVTEHLLRTDFHARQAPARIYDLAPLLTRHRFDRDPSDGIAGVHVAMLRLKPLDASSDRLVLEVARGADYDIWCMSSQRLGTANPLRGGWSITQARLIISLMPMGGARGERRLPVTITMPNGCDLKDRTEDERLIGERYLRRWGLRIDR